MNTSCTLFTSYFLFLLAVLSYSASPALTSIHKLLYVRNLLSLTGISYVLSLVSRLLSLTSFRLEAVRLWWTLSFFSGSGDRASSAGPGKFLPSHGLLLQTSRGRALPKEQYYQWCPARTQKRVLPLTSISLRCLASLFYSLFPDLAEQINLTLNECLTRGSVNPNNNDGSGSRRTFN